MRHSFRKDYVDFLLCHTGAKDLRPLKIYAGPGNGCAGLLLQELAGHLPYIFSYSNMEPDGTFPNGVPNPREFAGTHHAGRIAERYAPVALSRGAVDGLSLEFADWRCNIRKSNTEPLLRLNVETRANVQFA